MKPLPLAILIVAAAIASWWLFATDDVKEPDSGVGSGNLADGSDRSGDAQPARAPVIAATPEASGGTTKAPPPDAAPKPKKKWILPLADKFMDRAVWNDEEALVALRHVAEAARKGVRLSNTARKRLAAARITLDLGRTPVPRLLDHLTKPHTLGWNVKAGVIYIFDDDD